MVASWAFAFLLFLWFVFGGLLLGILVRDRSVLTRLLLGRLILVCLVLGSFLLGRLLLDCFLLRLDFFHVIWTLTLLLVSWEFVFSFFCGLFSGVSFSGVWFSGVCVTTLVCACACACVLCLCVYVWLCL